MYKFCFYVPETHLEAVKNAVFEAGAGKIGDYDSCCWQALGIGQFRPLEGSSPYLGQTGKVEKVDEYKVEMIVEQEIIEQVISVFIDAHPYEEPAYDVIKIESIIP